MASLKRRDIARRSVHKPAAGGKRGPGNVRRDEAVFCFQQRVIGGNRFARDNIDSRTPEPAAVERIGQIPLVNQRPRAVLSSMAVGFIRDSESALIIPAFVEVSGQ